MLLMNHSTKRQLEQALGRLGWEPYDGDLWRHRKTGVITAFLDAVVRELQTCNQATQPFQGRYFKPPDAAMVKPRTSSPGIGALVSYLHAVVRKLKSFLSSI